MKEFLSQKGVKYQEKDIARDERAREEMYRKTGMMAVPTLLIDGRVFIGFDREKLENMLH
ncbi:MAG: hypothetical protein PWP65_1684 [Clostridia bacterium]|nr:hypothetical protein [Clostridia bacterium]